MMVACEMKKIGGQLDGPDVSPALGYGMHGLVLKEDENVSRV